MGGRMDKEGPGIFPGTLWAPPSPQTGMSRLSSPHLGDDPSQTSTLVVLLYFLLLQTVHLSVRESKGS